jgi:uncharacterized protein (TIGR02284 family)
MSDPKARIDELKNLLQLCRDGQNGFREAAERITDPEVRAFFHEQSLERGRFVGELENELHRLGEKDVDTSGSVGGAVHRAWIDLKSALGGGEHAILAEAERGEDAAKEAYRKAIESKNLSQEILPTITRQYEAVQRAHDRVKAYRDAAKKAA